MNAEKVQEKAHDKVSERAHDKANEKVMEKRRALGRGLESLLPRPRAVTTTVAEPATPQRPRYLQDSPGDGQAGTPASTPQSAAAQPTAVQPTGVQPDVQPIAAQATAVQPGAQPTASQPEAAIEGTQTVQGPGFSAQSFSPEILSPQTLPPQSISAQSLAGHTAPVQTEMGEEQQGVSVAATGSEAAGTSVAPISPEATVAELMASAGIEEVLQLALDLIEQNPHQTRTRFREEPLKELAESIKVQGVLQPIVVRPGQEGRYRLILGERRMRATRMAGLETIPAIVKRVSEQQAAEMTLVENLQRQDLNCVEQAWAFSRLSQEFKLTQEQIGARVGMSREAVSNYMRLLTLPEGVHEMLIAGKLSYSHARALLKLNTSAQGVLWAYAKKALDEKMSVAKLEELVAGLPKAPKAPGQGGARWVDPNVKAAQRRLEEILGMRVRIHDQAGRGKIQIEYATIEDFDRVMEMLGGK